MLVRISDEPRSPTLIELHLASSVDPYLIELHDANRYTEMPVRACSSELSQDCKT